MSNSKSNNTPSRLNKTSRPSVPSRTKDASHANNTHSNPPQRRISHLAGAFVLGVILTTTIFVTTPLGKQSPRTNYTYTTKQPAQPASNTRQTNPTNNQQAATPNGQPTSDRPLAANQPADPQEALRQIQALNDYNRRLTQSNTPNLPSDPAAPNSPINHNHPPRTPGMPGMPGMPTGMPQPPSPYTPPTGP